MSNLKSITARLDFPAGVEVRAPLVPGDEAILSPQALQFVAGLERRFRSERDACLRARDDRQSRLDAGERPGFLPWTQTIREAEWKVPPPPPDLRDRRVEITGPTDRKMVINALNSGARVFMADFEDSNAPTWRNLVEGQKNLFDAVRRTISWVAPETGRHYELGAATATLMVRPRGWHLPEAHVIVDGRPMSGALFDFGLFFFHNASELIARGTGPYFYLPKLESHREARLWNEVFRAAQDQLGIARGTIRATVLIETILAAFEMDEILWELREHSAGLNCGRWDYIFSFIKKLRRDPSAVLPDRAQVTMNCGFLRAYSQLLVRTCHRRGAHAIGGMAAQIPVKADAERNRIALDKVRAEKRREAEDGHDGTWVAHPGLVEVAKAEFDAAMPGLNQIHVRRDDVVVTSTDLLQPPRGTVSEAGLRVNVSVGIRYLEAWLRGSGCVPLDDLMEDAATAEISRAQIWQWIRHGARLGDGRIVDAALFRSVLREEVEAIRSADAARFVAGRFVEAVSFFEELVLAPEMPGFLTLAAYPLLIGPLSSQEIRL